MAHLKSVNVGRSGPNPAGGARPSGMLKTPTPDPVLLRDPGAKRGGEGSGVAGSVDPGVGVARSAGHCLTAPSGRTSPPLASTSTTPGSVRSGGSVPWSGCA